MNAFYKALTSINLGAMRAVWAQGDYVTLVNPRDKAISVGSSNVDPLWQETFAFWKEIRITYMGSPNVHLDGDCATVSSAEEVTGVDSQSESRTFHVIATDMSSVKTANGRWFRIMRRGCRIEILWGARFLQTTGGSVFPPVGHPVHVP